MKEYMMTDKRKKLVKRLFFAFLTLAVCSFIYFLGVRYYITISNQNKTEEKGRLAAASLTIKLSLLKTAATLMTEEMEQIERKASSDEIFEILEKVIHDLKEKSKTIAPEMCRDLFHDQKDKNICSRLDYSIDIFQFGLGFDPEQNDGQFFAYSEKPKLVKERHLFLPYLRKWDPEKEKPDDCDERRAGAEYYRCTGVDDALRIKEHTKDDYSSELTVQGWYQKPMELGSSWIPPYFDDFTSSYLIEYAEAFTAKGKKEPTGVVYVNYDFKTMDEIINNLSLGKTGYLVGFKRLLGCAQGKGQENEHDIYEPHVFIHPVWENVEQQKTIYDVFSINESKSDVNEDCNKGETGAVDLGDGEVEDLFYEKRREAIREGDGQNSIAADSVHALTHMALSGYSGLVKYKAGYNRDYKELFPESELNEERAHWKDSNEMAYFGSLSPVIIGEGNSQKNENQDRWGFILFPDQTLPQELAQNKRFLIPIVISFLLTSILFLFIKVGYPMGWSMNSVWIIVFASSALFILVINLVWRFDNVIQSEKIYDLNPVLHSGSYNDYLKGIEKEKLKSIQDDEELYSTIEKEWEEGKFPHGSLYHRIPTGIHVQSLKFEGANDVQVTGKVWQRYTVAIEKALGCFDLSDCDEQMKVNFPEAVSLTMEKVYDIKHSCEKLPNAFTGREGVDQIIEQYLKRPEDLSKKKKRDNHEFTKKEISESDRLEWVKENCYRIIGWNFSATLRQEFNYHKYPLDHKDIWIRITGPDMRRVVPVPDLKSYANLQTDSLPGVADPSILPGWEIGNSFFNFHHIKKNSMMGVNQRDSMLLNPPELYYHIIGVRIFLNAFIKNLIPLIVVAAILFATLLIITKNPKKIELYGYNHSTIIGACSGLFFTVLLAHIQLRSEFEVEQVLYLEYFNFILYFMILLVALISFLFTHEYEIKFLDYRDNAISKILFWPLILAFLLLITLYIFWPNLQMSEIGQDRDPKRQEAQIE